jgi:replicative DNA helicase
LDVQPDNIEFVRRIAPHSQELEEAALSAVLQDPQEAMPVALEYLTRESFYYEPHAVIWEACVVLHRKGVPPDPLSVIAELRNRERLDLAGGESFVYQLLAAVPNASAIETHSLLLHEKYLLRSLIHECNDIIKRAYEQGQDVQELLDAAERKILQIDQGMAGGRFADLDSAIRNFLDSYETQEITDPDGTVRTTLKKSRGIPTGYRDLDKVLGGLKKGDLVIVAARPGVGKTALVMNFAYRMAQAGKRVGIFSLEMGKEQLAMRLLAMSTQIPSDRIDQGDFSESELTRLSDAYQDLANLPIYIDDTSTLNIRALRNRCRRLFSQQKVDIIMLDYLQLMEGMRPGSDLGRVQEVSEISRGLKQIARELNIPIIACSQLSRQVEHRQSRRPILSDLRESGSIEQDADVVMLMYREDYYEKQKGETFGTPLGSKVEINIAKHRNGPTAFVMLTYLLPYLRFEPYTGEDVSVDFG